MKSSLAKVISTVVLVGARKFVFSSQVQSSDRVKWWGTTEEERTRPDNLSGIFVRHGLARVNAMKSLASSSGVEFHEFGDESELFPHLRKALGIEPDPTKSPPPPKPPTIDSLLDLNGSGQEVSFGKGLVLKEDRIVDVPVNKIRRNENQLRTFFDPKRLLALGKSLVKGQRVPVILVPIKSEKWDYVICDGERRWRAAQKVGKPTLRAIIAQNMSEAELFKNSVICNLGREGHQPMEIAGALRKMKDDEGLTIDQLADECAMAVSMVHQHLNLLKLSPEVRAFVNPELPEGEGLAFLSAVEVSKVPSEYQLRAARHIIEHKMSVPQVRHYIRHLIDEVGGSNTRRIRKPHDDFKVFCTFVRAANERLEQLLDLPGGASLESIFRHRSWEDRENALNQLDSLSAQIKKMRTQIEQADQKKKTIASIRRSS